MDIEKELFKLQDKKYQEFQKKLCPETNNIIGVRIPVLRKFAKENKDKIDISKINTKYYEEIMLKGMLIGIQKNLDLKEIEKFIPLIDNWAICDTFCSGLKQVKNSKQEFLNFIEPYLNSNGEFAVRFAVVILLDYYIEDDYIDYILKNLSKIDREEYYINMAIAWCYAECFAKYYKKTYDFFKNTKLNKFVRNKSIQKAIESYRLTSLQKDELKGLKV